MEKNVLEVNKLNKTISNKTTIIHDLSFNIKKGEILGLLGPNGAGKTTTIRMLVGLVKKNFGTMKINGIDFDTNKNLYKQKIGAIVENPVLYDYLNGWKNLQQSARIFPDIITEKRLKEMIKLVRLDDVIQDKVSTYSLGMKQRLGIAQALLHKPSLLILDEPTNGLDPKGIHELRDYLHKLSRNGTSILVSSHLLSEMQLMCDRVLILNKGKVINETDVNSLSTEQKSIKIRFFNVNLKKVEDLLKRYDISIKHFESESITIDCEEQLIPNLNRYLVKHGMDILAIEHENTSLEEMFLSLTSEGIK